MSLCALAMGFALHAHAVVDPIEAPAVPMPKAAHTLLLGVAKAGTRLVAVGQYGIVVYSDDQGKNWQQAKVPVQLTLTDLFFVDDKTGWAVGDAAVILKTVDGGATWEKQHDGLMPNSVASQLVAEGQKKIDEAQAALDQADPNDEAARAELDERLFQAEDRIQALKKASNSPLLNVWFRDQSEGFAVGSYAQFYHTADGGKTWESWAHKLQNAENHNYDIWGDGSGLMLIVGETGNIFRSTDHGATWQTIPKVSPRSLYSIVPDVARKRLYITGMVGQVAYSDDQGGSWTAMPTHTEFSVQNGLIGADGKPVFIGNNGLFITEKSDGSGLGVYLRDDRVHMANIIDAGDGNFLTVGFAGVKRISPKGLDLPH
ncbi:MAG: hypothetical protein IT471_00965 [Pseudomonadales bacterium]|jgi:photosystem II stability/assembly factor-like uncharacterized protein|nr:hypothetical protein [Pseudomonadales bacterium]MCP5333359.1 hypothetical protein [Pseudomonadales bacterium]HMU90430.1 YCF48-related protein [Pseudomonadales bacterium]HMW15971.1 YCF48-related protein [Pseudomonadales bacterium]HMW82687.1 YCF48-related protein [Pseudomonadales bacterium]